MHTITLSTNREKICTIHIGIGALSQIDSLFPLKHYSHIFVLTDDLIAPLWLNKLHLPPLASITTCVLPSGEHQKRISTVEKIWEAMHEAGCDRKSLVINLGGGVLTDLGGFAAATFMRGIEFINIPTSVLSQVDASVGGKNGFNLAGIKNLIGSFEQPIGVIIDPSTLQTLPQRDFVAGFAEIIKHGLIWDANYFDTVSVKSPLEFNQTELTDIIAKSCDIKMAIIQGDINEQGNRKLVNFGHTIGHAVESLSLRSAHPLLHGEAVSIGMMTEARLSQEVALLPVAAVERIKSVLTDAGLPVAMPNPDVAALIELMKSDKKNENRQLNFTLLDRIGHAQINQKVPESVLKAVLHSAGDAAL